MLGNQSGSRDLTFEDLISQRPRSHTEGLLPRRYLAPDEVVLYETRPSFVGFALPGIAGSIVASVALVILLDALAASGASPGLSAGQWLLLYGLLVAIGVAGAIGGVLRWWYTAYAISTSRILVKEGAWSRRVIDIPHQAIQSAMFEETAMGRSLGYGTLQFSSASVAGFGFSRYGSRPGVINWRATPNPLETRAFFETVKKVEFQ
jgi:membrane protein YdbS with pleckstrin-like domain